VEQQAGVKPARFSRLDGAAIFGFLLPFTIVVYLALRGGGYDPINRGEFGIVVWWMVLLGAAAGVLSTKGLSRPAWGLLALFLGFTVWTGLGIAWSESSERSVEELARVAAYGGVLTLGLTIRMRDGLRRTIAGVGAAIAVVGVFALLSRLHPEWFPTNEAAQFLTEATRRLNYPVNYWNGLAALMALGIPILLWIATAAERSITRAVAAAAIPALALTAYFTLSRGGAVETAVALLVLVALYPRRLELLPTMLTCGLGGLILTWAGSRREELADGLSTPTAGSQANEMIVIVAVVCVVVGLLQWAIVRAAQRGVGPRFEISRSVARRVLVVCAGLTVTLALAAGAPGKIADGWETFKAPAGPTGGNTIERFSSASGNGRYQYWTLSVDAGEAEPLTGSGAGTWEFLWARDGTLPGFIRDAHSLYFETFAELGVVGVALIVGLMILVLTVGVRRALAADPQRRAALAAATASCAAFVTAAALDWSWELPVIPIAFLLVVAAVFTADRPLAAPPRVAIRDRAPLVGLALLGVVAVALPLPAAISIRSSQDSVNAGNLPRALDQAETAQSWQPYAAAPRLQQALVLEQAGELQLALAAAEEAVQRESNNWRNWFVLSRVEDGLGNTAEAEAAYRHAQELNPRSALFAE
jgi:hypothetical protein